MIESEVVHCTLTKLFLLKMPSNRAVFVISATKYSITFYLLALAYWKYSSGIELIKKKRFIVLFIVLI